MSLIAGIALPVTFNPLGYHTFGLPKVVLLRALVLVMVVIALLKAADYHQRSRLASSVRRTPIPIGLALAFGATLILATLFSANRQISL